MKEFLQSQMICPIQNCKKTMKLILKRLKIYYAKKTAVFIFDSIADERSELIVSFIEELEKHGPPPLTGQIALSPYVCKNRKGNIFWHGPN